ncbi:hypothetical protein [Sphaerisporangium perillae]|uniref:hypothetical protein n=1 Tax=Sphaerisporangium perillae TaxID=2935860 RepID=UPI00200C3C1E|nr:hypothetical protein [Sphaerisporangium perillae]
MTTTTTASARQMIERAAMGHYRTVYTTSVLDAAAQMLADLHATGERHGIAPADWAGAHGTDQRLAEAALLAQATAYRHASLADLDDPHGLLAEAAERAGLATADPGAGDDAPLQFMAESAASVPPLTGDTALHPNGLHTGGHGTTGTAGEAPVRASIHLVRLPQTPPWGWDGMAPLVVSLERFDSLTSPAWKWQLSPDVGEPSTQMVQVVAPPPSAASADEVFTVARQALTGALRLYL